MALHRSAGLPSAVPGVKWGLLGWRGARQSDAAQGSPLGTGVGRGLCDGGLAWFGRHGGARLMVGPDDLRGLCQL